jgi:hypothetical protein
MVCFGVADLPGRSMLCLWHHSPVPETDSEQLRREADELRQKAQRLIEEAARLLTKSNDLEKQVAAHDGRKK